MVTGDGRTAGLAQKAKRHAIISGTGRAGTSYLVRFFDACGLDTGGRGGPWSPRARAGLEHAADGAGIAPYVIKDPWLFTYCEELDLAELQIDALIVPVRELMHAAESRVHQERLALTHTSFLLRRRNLQLAAATPGGVVYSLDVVDQARILAVGFHRLMRWAAINELPVFLLDFPRTVTDCDYLLRVLWPWLGEWCSAEQARKAFAEVADESAIRVRDNAADRAMAFVVDDGEPERAAVDRTALVERIEELAAAEQQATVVQAHAGALQERLDAAIARVAELEQQLAAPRRWPRLRRA